MCFGIGRRIPTTAIACAGNGSAHYRASGSVEPCGAYGRKRLIDSFAGNIRDEQILPDSESQFAASKRIRDIGKCKHLLHRQTANRHRDANVVETMLALRMNADMPCAVDRIAR